MVNDEIVDSSAAGFPTDAPGALTNTHMQYKVWL